MKILMWKMVAVLLISGLFLTGCGGKVQKEKDQVVLTENEMELLAARFGDEDNIRAGILKEDEKDAVLQLRAGESYLAGKYPGAVFMTIYYDSVSEARRGKAVCIVKDEDDDMFTLTVTKDGDGYSCADDYYGKLMRNGYDAELQEYLMDGGIDAVCYSEFPALMGIEVDGTESLAVLNMREPSLKRHSDIFVLKKKVEWTTAPAVRSILEENRAYGDYTLYYMPNDLGTDKKVLEENRIGHEVYSFSIRAEEDGNIKQVADR